MIPSLLLRRSRSLEKSGSLVWLRLLLSTRMSVLIKRKLSILLKKKEPLLPLALAEPPSLQVMTVLPLLVVLTVWQLLLVRTVRQRVSLEVFSSLLSVVAMTMRLRPIRFSMLRQLSLMARRLRRTPSISLRMVKLLKLIKF